jgi:DNA invertase Pin-like site-specific DNA recombinase
MTVKPQLRAGAYLRISSDPNDTRAGITRQREDTTDVIADRGWVLATDCGADGFFIDNDVSASSGKPRPNWERLLADIKVGKIDAIAIWVQDRGWRMMEDLIDLSKFARALEKDTGRRIPIGTTSGSATDYDLYDPDGMYRMQIETANSEREVKKMSVKIRRASKDAAEQGLQNGTPRPFGYEPGGATIKGRGDPNGGGIRESEAKELRRVAQKVIAGEATLHALAADLNRRGILTSQGKPWHPTTLKRCLLRPRNVGDRQLQGKVLDGVVANWEPIFDRATYNELKRKLIRGNPNGAGRKAGGGPAPKHLGTNLYKCGACGQPKLSRTVQHGVPMYRCTARNVPGISNHVGRKAEPLDEHVQEWLLTYLTRDRFVEEMCAVVQGDDAATKKLLAEKKAIDGDLAELKAAQDARKITVADYIDGCAGIKARREEIDTELASMSNGSSLEVLRDRMRDRDEPVEALWGRLTLNQKRAILAETATVTIMPVPKGPKFNPGANIQPTEQARQVIARLGALHGHGELTATAVGSIDGKVVE